MGGGTEERVARILGHLDRQQFEVSWLGFGPIRDDLAQTANIQPVTIARNVSAGVELRAILRVARALRRVRADVLHVHNWSTSLYGIAGAAIAGTPFVLYGSGGRETAAGASGRRRRLMQALAPHVSLFTTVCEFLAEELREEWKIDADRVRIIRTGVDLEHIARAPEPAQSRDKLGIPRDALVIGTVGVIRPVKRMQDLIRAAARIAHRHPNLHLAVVGPCVRVVPSDLQAIAAQCGLSGRFHLPGLVRDPTTVLPAFDVFVNCSEFEGSSNAIIEAMATRLPVVGTRVGGTPELVDDRRTGFLVEPGDPPGLADALERLVNDARLRAEYGSAGRRRVETRHTLKSMLREIATVYQNAQRSTQRFLTRARTIKGVAETLVRVIEPAGGAGS